MRAQDARCAIPRHWPVTARWVPGNRAPGETPHSALNSPPVVASKQQTFKTILEQQLLPPGVMRNIEFPQGPQNQSWGARGGCSQAGGGSWSWRSALLSLFGGMRSQAPPSQLMLLWCCLTTPTSPQPQQQHSSSRWNWKKLSWDWVWSALDFITGWGLPPWLTDSDRCCQVLLLMLVKNPTIETFKIQLMLMYCVVFRIVHRYNLHNWTFSELQFHFNANLDKSLSLLH